MANLCERIFWNMYARSYDNLARHFRPYQDLVKEVCGHIDVFANGSSLRILDAGCGTGNYSIELARRGHTVIGIDNSGSMIARAVKKTADIEGISFMEHDLTQRLPFDDGEFGAVVSVHVFYTMEQPERLAAEIARVLSSQGILVGVTLQKPIEVFGSLAEAYQEHGILVAAETLFALFGVGIFNLIISSKQKGGTYKNMDALAFRAFLSGNSFETTHTNTTYTRDVSVLAIASQRVRA